MPPSNLTPAQADEILWRLLRPLLPPSPTERSAGLSDGLNRQGEGLPSPLGRGAGGESLSSDWQLIQKRAERHGISALLYGLWHNRPDSPLPPHLLNDWKTTYYTNLARHQLFTNELTHLISLLTSRQIEIILLKGAFFSHDLYPDPAYRPMSDIDLLLHEQHIPLAVQTLKTAGYIEPFVELNKQDFLERSHHIHLKQASPPSIDVELHWRLIAGDESRFLPEMDWFWNQTKSWQNEPAVFTLTPTANLLFACAHLALQHGFGLAAILWFVDIALLLQKYQQEIDWSALIQQAQACQWSAAVYYTLQENQTRFDIEPPSTVMQTLQANITPFEESYIKTKTLPGQNMAMLGWTIFTSLSWPARLKTTFAHIFPQPGFMIDRYKIPNRWLVPFYYPYRWWDMAGKLLYALRLRLKNR